MSPVGISTFVLVVKKGTLYKYQMLILILCYVKKADTSFSCVCESTVSSNRQHWLETNFLLVYFQQMCLLLFKIPRLAITVSNLHDKTIQDCTNFFKISLPSYGKILQLFFPATPSALQRQGSTDDNFVPQAPRKECLTLGFLIKKIYN